MADDATETVRARELAAQQLIQENQKVFGPFICPECRAMGDDAEAECDHDENDYVLIEGLVQLQEFILVAVWTDLDSGESYIGDITGPKQMRSRTLGLLYDVLSD